MKPRNDAEAGEMWIRGPHVSSGYWNNPQATAEAYVDGWFRTGDIARRDADGYFFIAGRRKEMFHQRRREHLSRRDRSGAAAASACLRRRGHRESPTKRGGEVGIAFRRSRTTSAERRSR